MGRPPTATAIQYVTAPVTFHFVHGLFETPFVLKLTLRCALADIKINLLAKSFTSEKPNWQQTHKAFSEKLVKEFPCVFAYMGEHPSKSLGRKVQVEHSTRQVKTSMPDLRSDKAIYQWLGHTLAMQENPAHNLMEKEEGELSVSVQSFKGMLTPV